MDKQTLRKNMLCKLKKMNAQDKVKVEQNLISHLSASTIWQNAHCIGMTVSQFFEWNTKPLMNAAWQAGKQVALPKCEPMHRQLHFYTIEHMNELEKGYAGLLEPKVQQTQQIQQKDEIDLLIVPGLVFDRYGYRIGFGGGYYDRFLVDFEGITLSLVSEFQIHHRIPINDFDQSVHYLCTEKALIKTKDRKV